MTASAVHLMAKDVHPSEASDVHDGIFSTPVGIYSTPCEAPDLHDKICRPLDGKCSTHRSEAPEVHLSVVPNVR